MRLILYIVITLLFPFAAICASQSIDSPDNTHLRNLDLYGDSLPIGAIARMGTIRLRHNGPVPSISFSPDSSILISGGYDGIIRLWDITTGKENNRISLQAKVLILSTMNSNMSVYCENGNIYYYVIPDCRLIRTIKPNHNVLCMAFSTDCKYLATGGSDHKIILWDLATGTQSQIIQEYDSAVRSIAFSSDGNTLVSTGSGNGAIRLWDVKSGRELKTILGSKRLVFSAAFSPNGRTLASGGAERIVHIWDTATGNELRQINGLNDVVIFVVYSPDGNKLASLTRSGTIYVWDVDTGKEYKMLNGSRIPFHGFYYSLAFSPDGKILASGSYDGVIRLWDIASGKRLHSCNAHDGDISSVCYSFDNTMLASSGEDLITRIWDTNTGTLRFQFNGGGPLAMSPVENILALGHADGSVSLFNVLSGERIIKVNKHVGMVRAIAYTADGCALITGGADSMIYMWNSTSGNNILEIAGHKDKICSLACSSNGYIISGSLDGTVKLWGMKSGVEISSTSIRRQDGVISDVPVSISLNGQRLAWGDYDGVIHVGTVSGIEICRLVGHKGNVNSIDISPNGKYLISGGDDGKSRLWETEKGKQLAMYDMMGGVITVVRMSTKLHLMVSGSNTLIVWDLSSALNVDK